MSEKDEIYNALNSLLHQEDNAMFDMRTIAQLVKHPLLSKTLNDAEEFSKKYRIRPDVIYSFFDGVAPTGHMYRNMVFDRLGKFFNQYPKLANDYIDMVMRNLQTFEIFHDLMLGEEEAVQPPHEYKDFLIDTHDYIYHGTSLNSFNTIVEYKEIIATDYSDSLNPKEFDPNAFDGAYSHSGLVFLTDGIDTAVRYALSDGDDGVIICLDLFGETLKKDANQTYKSREFVSDKPISINHMKKAYSVSVRNNQIVFKEKDLEK